ncbi:MAG: GNAT family N-acetyltransferase [Chloroflexi bacterium]|nr:GNAT family N-acetyltransferase [Chloroflexota bacterium]
MFEGYPKEVTLKGGEKATLRLTGEGDTSKLITFFASLPEEDRQFISDDVTSRNFIESWARSLDYNRVVPLLAEVSGQMVAHGVLRRHRDNGPRRHVGKIRVVVGPGSKRKGLGFKLSEELIGLSAEIGLETLISELVYEERPAIIALETLGFRRAAVLPGLVKDAAGANHDLVIMIRSVTQPSELAWAEDWY